MQAEACTDDKHLPKLSLLSFSCMIVGLYRAKPDIECPEGMR